MSLGIRPTVDFVFKLLFGSPENVDLLIHLLNAVLNPEFPIVEVELINPYSKKAFQKDKLSIVDVKARDSSGVWYVIEMQTTIPTELRNRLAYYTSDLFRQQMEEGKSYGDLRPAISICFLTKSLFSDVSAGHLCFSLYDQVNSVSFGDQIQVHLIELSKYHVEEEDLSEAAWLEKWVYFFTDSERRDAKDLRRLLPDPAFQKATKVLEMITDDPELRVMYEDRLKEARDKSSLVQDALAEGERRGERRGEARGEARGKAEGRAEGEAKGKLVGQVQASERFLGLAVTDDAVLSAMKLEVLARLASDLEQQFKGKS